MMVGAYFESILSIAIDFPTIMWLESTESNEK